MDGADTMPPQLCNRRRDDGVGKCLDGMLTGGVTDVDHHEPPLPEADSERSHRKAGPDQAMEKNDAGQCRPHS